MSTLLLLCHCNISDLILPKTLELTATKCYQAAGVTTVVPSSGLGFGKGWLRTQDLGMVAAMESQKISKHLKRLKRIAVGAIRKAKKNVSQHRVDGVFPTATTNSALCSCWTHLYKPPWTLTLKVSLHHQHHRLSNASFDATFHGLPSAPNNQGTMFLRTSPAWSTRNLCILSKDCCSSAAFPPNAPMPWYSSKNINRSSGIKPTVPRFCYP